MKQYLAAVEAMVRSKFEQRKPNEIRAELRRLRRKFKPEKEGLQEAKKILKLAERNLEDAFIKKFTREFTELQYDSISSKFEKGVLAEVRRSMNGFASQEKLYKRISELQGIANGRVAAIISTAKAGLTEARKIETARSAGIKYFRYVGPTTNLRQFCAERIGKIYSLDEILAMDNRQGLPPLYFCGGWNCRHRWVAVDEETALRERAK